MDRMQRAVAPGIGGISLRTTMQRRWWNGCDMAHYSAQYRTSSGATIAPAAFAALQLSRLRRSLFALYATAVDAVAAALLRR